MQYLRGLFLVAGLLSCAGLPPGTSGTVANPVGGIRLSPRVGVHDDGRFSILAVTDLHLSYPLSPHDHRTIDALKGMIARHAPDLLLINGDTWHNNNRGKGLKCCQEAGGLFAELGVPWAFVWGNHDKMNNYDGGHRVLERAGSSLYGGGSSSGNYVIEVVGEGGLLEWAIFVLNSGVDGLGDSQLEFFERETDRLRCKHGVDVPSFVFCHIPTPEFGVLYASGVAKGVLGDHEVCCENTPFGAAARLARSGTAKALFCGHDHLNCFEGRWNELHLESLRCTGYGGYGGDTFPRGGTLITVDTETDEWDSCSVYPDGGPRPLAAVFSEPLGTLLATGHSMVLSGTDAPITATPSPHATGEIRRSRTGHGRTSIPIEPVAREGAPRPSRSPSP